MHIAICEDDRTYNDELKRLLEHNGYIVSSYFTGDEMWFAYQDYVNPFDAILLDLHLPGDLNGIEAATKIRRAGDDAAVIILTNFAEYALQGYDIQAQHYLIKPVEDCRLLAILEQVEAEIAAKRAETLLVSVKGGVYRIKCDDILYIESRGHFSYVVTNEERLKFFRKISELYELCDERFICPHKSYIVNMRRIFSVNGFRDIRMDNGDIVPISRQRKSEFIRHLSMFDIRFNAFQA